MSPGASLSPSFQSTPRPGYPAVRPRPASWVPDPHLHFSALHVNSRSPVLEGVIDVRIHDDVEDGDFFAEGHLVAQLQDEEGAPERNIRLTGQRIDGRFVTKYILAIIGVWVALITPISVTLAIRVGQIDPVHKATSLALVASLGALASIFAN